jgi:hypothetical protein
MTSNRQQHLEALKQICKDTIWPDNAAAPIFPARVDGMMAHQTWQAWCQLSQERQSADYGNKLDQFIREQGQARFDAMPSAVPPDVQRRKDALLRKR